MLLLLLLPSVFSYSDFVARVDCEAGGMRIRLKETLPTPRSGMWDLEIESFPDCPAVTKTDVGGGHEFLIPFEEKELCGVDAEYIMTPKRLAQARTILLLKDDNGTIIADSVSCVYKTKFKTSMLTYSGEVRSENLVYGGTLESDGSDVEATVRSADAVSMDFFSANGAPLQQRNVQLGDPLLFRIAVSGDDQVGQILPENCYFSSSSVPETGHGGGNRILPFVTKSCFNEKDGMVRAFLPKMERSGNGTAFEMAFPAFYFTGHGQNLFVHCTVLACVGTTTGHLCNPHPNCFGSSRRKRSISERTVVREAPGAIDEVVLTKYVIVQDRTPNQHSRLSGSSAVCVGQSWAIIGTAAVVFAFLCLCSALFVLLNSARQARRKARWAETRLLCGQPPTYTPPVTNLSAKPNPAAF